MGIFLNSVISCLAYARILICVDQQTRHEDQM